VTTLVYGLAVAGRSTARFLAAQGETLVLADDRRAADNASFASSLGAELLEGPDAAMSCARRMGEFARLAPSPGVPESHPIITSAQRAGVEVVSEIELAYRAEQAGGRPRPIVAITGTDGKTTTTLMAAAMMAASGRRSAAVGNTETPWVEALDESHDCFAVECSSFRLHFTRDFRAEAAVWLNLAPDHLDWHRDLDSYRRAKTRVWAAARSGDVAVAPVNDDVIGGSARSSNARVVTFGLRSGDYRVEANALVGPQGRIVDIGQLSRALPHDLTNALAASAMVLEAGLGSVEGVAGALARYQHAPHRIQRITEIDGVSYYDDSKATSPHAAQAALTSFERIVLIAGGKNKGLDLSSMASQPGRMRAVVAIGHSADLIAAAFAGVCRVERAESMEAAVESARRLAEPGDAVLLSPGCTSYDWYSNYAERGDDFARCVRSLAGGHEQ
jgi:UDP-N-acetylmuramoylalanine--D-glutamate ligase